MILVGIQAHAGMQEAIKVNCPFWPNPQYDIIGLEGDDSPVEWWPDWIKGKVVSKIRPGRWLGYGFRPTLLVDSIAGMCDFAGDKYEWLLWTECDSIFLNGSVRPEACKPIAFNALIAGWCPPEWKGGSGAFIHPPFLLSIDVARRWVSMARSMSTEHGNGAPDVFAPIVCNHAGIPLATIDHVWSCNGLDMRLASKMREARKAANNGCWHIHGIKRQDHQDYILGRTDNFPADTL